MWILGHLALGYFSAFSVSRYTKEKIIIPVVWFFSMVPDLDELFYRYIVHRGPSHSIVVAIIVFIPVLLVFRSGWAYFAALASHILIGDFFVPPTQMFWPLSRAWFGAPSAFQLTGVLETVVEVSLFALMAVVIFYRRRFIFDSPSESS
jgi:membrane-bound metal-dependent hydrolase YbcI (DUF457 family)